MLQETNITRSGAKVCLIEDQSLGGRTYLKGYLVNIKNAKIREQGPTNPKIVILSHPERVFEPIQVL